MTGHDKVHYVVAAVLVAAIAIGAWVIHKDEGRLASLAQIAPASSVPQATFGFGEATAKQMRAGRIAARSAWPALTSLQVITIGDALKNSGIAKAKVEIFCAADTCKSLEADIDDAFQLAGWDDDFEGSPALGADEVGLLIGPPGNVADALKAALTAVMPTVSVRIVPLKADGDAGIIIGRRKP